MIEMIAPRYPTQLSIQIYSPAEIKLTKIVKLGPRIKPANSIIKNILDNVGNKYLGVYKVIYLFPCI